MFQAIDLGESPTIILYLCENREQMHSLPSAQLFQENVMNWQEQSKKIILWGFHITD